MVSLCHQAIFLPCFLKAFTDQQRIKKSLNTIGSFLKNLKKLTKHSEGIILSKETTWPVPANTPAIKISLQTIFPGCGVCWRRHSDMLCSCCGVCQSLDWAKQGLEAIFSLQMGNAIQSMCSVFLPGSLMLSHKTKYLVSTSTVWFYTWIMLTLFTSQNVETWIAFWPSVCWIIGKHFVWFQHCLAPILFFPIVCHYKVHLPPFSAVLTSSNSSHYPVLHALVAKSLDSQSKTKYVHMKRRFWYYFKIPPAVCGVLLVRD